jgi:tetratricopeptide (TPR) repeat protein
VFYHGSSDKWPAATWLFQQATDLAAWQTFFRRHPVTPSTPTNDNLSWLAFPVAPEPQAPAADVLLALSRYDSALAVLRAANQRPKVRYPLDYEEGLFALACPPHYPYFDILYSAAHVLSLRAVAELDQGQNEKALQDILLALRLADSFQQEPYDQLHRSRAAMLRFCVQPIWEGLAGHRWNEAQLLTLQQRFANMDLLPEFNVWARGETITLMNLADQFHAFPQGRGSPWGDRLASAEDSDRFWAWLFRIVYPVGWLYQDKVWIYRFYERRADVSKALDLSNAQQWLAEMRRAIDPALLIMVAPKLQEVVREGAQGVLFFQTVCQEVTVACALERCRLAQGQYPGSLDALVPTWLKQVPTDLLVLLCYMCIDLVVPRG